jgi:hypothetical protein
LLAVKYPTATSALSEARTAIPCFMFVPRGTPFSKILEPLRSVVLDICHGDTDAEGE